jgi:putative SOS response-associated peptidase YedK
MCGRAASSGDPTTVAQALELPESTPKKRMEEFKKSQNISPGMNVPVAYCAGESIESVEIGCMVWGLVPSFTNPEDKPNYFKMFNARVETVESKPTFKRLLKRRRCVISFEGYYEWKKDEQGQKQPYYVHYKDNRPMLFAGLYDSVRRSCSTKSELVNSQHDTDSADHMYTFTILTTDASPRVQWLHDRIPAILPTDVAKLWLDVSVTAESILPLLKPCNDDNDLTWHPVSKKVNTIKYQEDDCKAPIDLGKSQPQQRPISDFFLPKKSSSTKQVREEESEDGITNEKIIYNQFERLKRERSPDEDMKVEPKKFKDI